MEIKRERLKSVSLPVPLSVPIKIFARIWGVFTLCIYRDRYKTGIRVSLTKGESMGRVPRGVYTSEGGFYHLIVRGNNGITVFEDEFDFRRYLTFLAHYKERYCIKLYAYCLMTNHTHILAEAPHQKSLSKFMHGLNFKYSLYHQGRYERTGHLWQGRYKSYVIEKEEYLLACVQYIEQNPVKAGLVPEPSAYPWSSYRSRMTGEGPLLLTPLPV